MNTSFLCISLNFLLIWAVFVCSSSSSSPARALWSSYFLISILSSPVLRLDFLPDFLLSKIHSFSDFLFKSSFLPRFPISFSRVSISINDFVNVWVWRTWNFFDFRQCSSYEEQQIEDICNRILSANYHSSSILVNWRYLQSNSFCDSS